MTILAGILSRHPSVQIPDSVCESLKTNISRNPEDRPIEFRDARAFLVKVDIGAFGRPAHRRSARGSFAMLAGEPLLTCEGPKDWERDSHLEYLQTQWDDGDFQSLRSASGTFCAVYYDPRTGTAHLVADRLGLRPLYYTVVNEFVYFASALRILEALQEVPKTMDVLCVAESTGFGYPFGGGTPYAGIKMLQACEIITIHGGAELQSSRYFQWDSIVPSEATEEEALEETFRKFQAAVRRRLRSDKTTFANLSGGLDSRCTVAALRAEGARVYTFNFSKPDTQDQVFGREFAQKIGTIHHEVPTQPEPDWSQIIADAWHASPHRKEQNAERPMLVWSGEGGSVGLGHVYISPEIVSLMRSGNLSGAIDAFLRQQKKTILTGILDSKLAGQFDGHLHSRLRSELEAIHYPDPLRALYIFLNLNGPRRHLEGHFDTLDRHRIEFLMPFNDSEFLECLTAIPVEPCLYHQFYVKWLSRFDPAVLAVPWQAYPGHVPSPIPIPDSLPDQWKASASSSHKEKRERDLLANSAVMLSDPDFPRRVLRKSHLQLMRWAWKLRLGNYAYALEAALAYYRYWKIAGGRCELPAAPSVRLNQADQ